MTQGLTAKGHSQEYSLHIPQDRMITDSDLISQQRVVNGTHKFQCGTWVCRWWCLENSTTSDGDHSTMCRSKSESPARACRISYSRPQYSSPVRDRFCDQSSAREKQCIHTLHWLLIIAYADRPFGWWHMNARIHHVGYSFGKVVQLRHTSPLIPRCASIARHLITPCDQ